MPAKKSFPTAVTPKFRAIGAYVFEPAPPMQNRGKDEADKTPQYSLGMIFDPKDPVVKEELQKMIRMARDLAQEEWADINPKAIRLPFRNGNTDEDLLGSQNAELFAGKYFARAKSKNQPQVVGRDRKPLMNPDSFYSGCYAIASVAMYTYEYMSKKGVSLLLNNVMKVGDGERLTRRRSAQEDFADVDVGAGGDDDSEDDLI